MKTPIEERAYLDGMEWKRKAHAACGTRLIESYSWWNNDQDLLNKVEALLRANGVELTIGRCLRRPQARGGGKRNGIAGSTSCRFLAHIYAQRNYTKDTFIHNGGCSMEVCIRSVSSGGGALVPVTS